MTTGNMRAFGTSIYGLWLYCGMISCDSQVVDRDLMLEGRATTTSSAADSETDSGSSSQHVPCKISRLVMTSTLDWSGEQNAPSEAFYSIQLQVNRGVSVPVVNQQNVELGEVVVTPSAVRQQIDYESELDITASVKSGERELWSAIAAFPLIDIVCTGNDMSGDDWPDDYRIDFDKGKLDLLVNCSCFSEIETGDCVSVSSSLSDGVDR